MLALSPCIMAKNFQRFNYLPVTVNNQALLYPWAGGLNNALFGKTDVNHDGKKDLVVYDKTNENVMVFLTQGQHSTAYKFDATYAAHFPRISDWMILKDYNCDGIEDLFMYNGIGNLKVYAGFYRNDTLNFKLQQDGFFYKTSFGGYSNVYCANAIKPAVVDVNKDGDLDVISFSVSFNRLIYYENQQKESGLGCDSLLFKKTDNCWGNVRDTFASSYAMRDTCSFKFNRIAAPGNILHSGSAVEAVDVDNNGAIDVLIGSTTLSNMTMLYNKGTATYASILLQDVGYPGYDVGFNSVSFASPYFLDADNDGKTDLLVSTFDVGSANINNMWFYKNSSADSIKLQLQQRNFLVDQMIDVGENSYPCFMDVDGDGLKDLIVGSGGRKDYINPAVYTLMYFRNTGTAAQPSFNLQDDDFLNASTFNIKDLIPAAGDIDNDGDTDLIAGMLDGRLLFWENTASPGNAPVLVYKGVLQDSAGNAISVGTDAAPYLIDIDRDGKTDLVIGEQKGNLNLYKGTAAGSAKLAYVTDSFGHIRIVFDNNNNSYTQPTIADVNGDGKYDLALGTNLNGLQFYNNIEDHLNDAWTLASLAVPDYLGFRTTSAMADITGDGKLEMVTGNINGGLVLFSQEPPPNLSAGIKMHELNTLDFDIYPNPCNQFADIQIDGSETGFHVEVFNSLGQELLFKKSEQKNMRVFTGFPNGIYVFKITSGLKQGIRKIVIQH
jgi:hypothetical protein